MVVCCVLTMTEATAAVADPVAGENSDDDDLFGDADEDDSGPPPPPPTDPPPPIVETPNADPQTNKPRIEDSSTASPPSTAMPATSIPATTQNGSVPPVSSESSSSSSSPAPPPAVATTSSTETPQVSTTSTTLDTETKIPRKSKASQESAATAAAPKTNAKTHYSGERFGLDSAVRIPVSVEEKLLQGSILEKLKTLPSNLANDALQEYDDALLIKGKANIRNQGAYLFGVIKRYVSVQERAASGEGPAILPMGEGLTPLVNTRLDTLVTSGFCTREEMNEKVKSKIRMLSEKDALFAIEELSSAERSSIRNFGSYFMGILNRYMRGDTGSRAAEAAARANRFDRNNRRDRDRGDRNFRDGGRASDHHHARDRSRDRFDDHNPYGPSANDRDRPGPSPYQDPYSRGGHQQQQQPLGPYNPGAGNQQGMAGRGQMNVPPPPPPQYGQRPAYMQQQHPQPPERQRQHQQQQPPNPYNNQTMYPHNPGPAAPPMQSMGQSFHMPPQQNSSAPPPPPLPPQNPYQQQQNPPPMGAPANPQGQSYPPPGPNHQNQFVQQQQPSFAPVNAGGPYGAPPQQPPQQYGSNWQQQQQPQLQQQQQQQQPHQQQSSSANGMVDILALADKASSVLRQNQTHHQPPASAPQFSSSPNSMPGPPYAQNNSFPPPSNNMNGFAPRAPQHNPSGGNNNRHGHSRRHTTANMNDLPTSVRYALQNLVATGQLEKPPDEGILGMIFDLPESMALQALQKFTSINKAGMRSRTAYLAGVLRRELEKINKR
mmetsp:Transcript_22795/g.63372  ORF Transcript_22795/g.63372 Transcript_22795/m.63372 type:complete len:774 (-) Transcript_22795:4638-6959(-)